MSRMPTAKVASHSPVIFTMKLQPGVLHWRCPRPRPPPLLLRSLAELRTSSDWEDLIIKWKRLPTVQAFNPERSPNLVTLSQGLHEALHQLVALAGGWSTRAAHRRPAYDSDALCSSPSTGCGLFWRRMRDMRLAVGRGRGCCRLTC